MALKIAKLEAMSATKDGIEVTIKFREETVKRVTDVLKAKSDMERSVEFVLKGGPLEVAQTLELVVKEILAMAEVG